MKLSSKILLIVCSFLVAQTAAAGDIVGRVTLKGTPPPEKVIAMDEICDKEAHSQPVTTRHFVVGPEGGLANVFIYISKGLEDKRFASPAKPAELDQVGCMYEPYIQGVMVGQKLLIKNSDSCLHNVHAVPKATGNKEFNFVQVNHGQADERTFSAPEVVVKFKCDVHTWMFAYVGVLSHPFFAVTDINGSFRIPDVPSGQYTLTAYHQKSHGTTVGISKEFAITTNQVANVDFMIEIGAKK